MKIAKKTIPLLLALLLTVSIFSACSKKEDTPAVSDKPDASESPSPSADNNSGGNAFNFDFGAPLDKDGFFKGVKASKGLIMPEYIGISIPESVVTANPDDVQYQIDAFLEQYAEPGEPIMDRAVEDGDTLNIDYVGSVDGVEFEGGSTGGKGTEVTIGVTNYIDDFLQQLIGHMPGENFDIEVTFPDPYTNPDLAGKDAVFNITINEIVGESILPELTDEIAIENGFESADAMVADIEAWLINQQKNSFFKGLLMNCIIDEIPSEIMDFLKDADLAYYKYYAEMYGMTLEDILVSMTGCSTVEEYQDSQEQVYLETGLFYLGCQAIAEKEGLTATAEDIEKYGQGDYLAMYGEKYMKMYVLQNYICRDFVFDNAEIIVGE